MQILSSDPSTLEFIDFLRLIFSNPEMIPEDWASEATTYDLNRHSSEKDFVQKFLNTAQHVMGQHIKDAPIILRYLINCGHPYDYARLGQVLSTLYELLIQKLTQVDHVVSFASKTKPFLALIESSKNLQHFKLYSDAALPLSEKRKEKLIQNNVQIFEHWTDKIPDSKPDDYSIFVSISEFSEELLQINADAITFSLEQGGVLLLNTSKGIDVAKIQVIRKRTISALLAVDSKLEIENLLGISNTHSIQNTRDLKAQCDQLMQNIYPALHGKPLYFCTGLAAEAAIFAASANVCGEGEPVRLYYAQNGYGGTGQLISEILPQESPVNPCPLKVLGTDEQGNIKTIVDYCLEDLKNTRPQKSMIFLETPTNPELQTHDFKAFIQALKNYHAEHGIQIPVIVDTTMAPLNPLLEQEFAKDWPFVVVKSGSKYYTKGKATLGVAFSVNHPMSQEIMRQAKEFGFYADSFAKVSQLEALNAGLQDLKARMNKIAQNTAQITAHMRKVMTHITQEFTCYSMTPEQVEKGFFSGIISFYLPPIPPERNIASVVDKFVWMMLANAPDLIRNRVSYGQSSGKDHDFIYIINPEESTQGALSKEVKEAQKKDNVQICRISVPEKLDVNAFNQAFSKAIEEIYINKYAEVPTRAVYASNAYDGNILDYYRGTFEAVYIIYHPFASTKGLSKDQIDNLDDLTDLEPVSWQDILDRSEGLNHFADIDQGLRSLIGGINKSDEIQRFEKELKYICETHDYLEPYEGNIHDLIENHLYKAIQSLGYEKLWVSDEFNDEKNECLISDLLQNSLVPIHGSVYTDDKALLLSSQWDSHCTFLCSSKENIDKILAQDDFEGFFCTPFTEVYWGLYPI